MKKRGMWCMIRAKGARGHGVDSLLSMICDSEFATMPKSFRLRALRKRSFYVLRMQM
jgi:hypothetical protein